MKRKALFFMGSLSGIAFLGFFSTASLLAQGGSGRITPTTRGTTTTTTTTTNRTTKPTTTSTNTTRRTTNRTTRTTRTTTRTYDYYYNIAMTAFDQKEYDKAITNFTQAIRLNPRSSDALYNRGLAYYEIDDYENAIEDYTKSIQIKPAADAYNNRGLAYEMNGNFRLAADDYRMALRIQPNYTLARNNLTRVERQSSNNSGGGGSGGAGDGNSRNNNNNNRNDVKYYVDLADSYFDKNDFTNALVNYNRAIQIDPRGASPYVRRGFVYHYTGEVAKAYEDYDTAARLNPSLKNEEYMKCMMYDSSEDSPTLGIRSCTATINEFPAFSLGYYKRGVAYYVNKDYTRAMQDFTKSIDIIPNFFNSYVYRGLIYVATDRYSSGVTEYTRAIQIMGANNTKAYLAYNNRGVAYEFLGNLSQATTDYRKSLELNPNFTLARDNLNKVLQKQRGNY